MAAFEQLQAYHDKKSFSCGEAVLDDFLHAATGQEPEGIWVLVKTAGDPEIITYCAMHPDPVQCVTDGGLYLGNVDVVWLRYLATDSRHKCQGYGEAMLMFAIDRTVEATDVHPIQALMLDPLDEARRDYYLRRDLGFKLVNANSLRLSISITDMRALVRDAV